MRKEFRFIFGEDSEVWCVAEDGEETFVVQMEGRLSCLGRGIRCQEDAWVARTFLEVYSLQSQLYCKRRIPLCLEGGRTWLWSRRCLGCAARGAPYLCPPVDLEPRRCPAADGASESSLCYHLMKVRNSNSTLIFRLTEELLYMYEFLRITRFDYHSVRQLDLAICLH